MSWPDAGGRPAARVAGAVEVALEAAACLLIYATLWRLLARIPFLDRPFLPLPGPLAPFASPAFGLALAVGGVGGTLVARRLLGGWGPRQLTGGWPAHAARHALLGMLLAALIHLWSLLLAWVQPGLFDAAHAATGIRTGRDALLAAAWVAPVGAALAEEILFRGYLQGALASRLGAGWGILLAAVAFTALHAGQGPAALLAVGPAALGLGLLYRATGSLLAPWVAHTAVDVIAFLRMGAGGAQVSAWDLPLAAVAAMGLVAGRRPLGDALRMGSILLSRAVSLREGGPAAATILAAGVLLPVLWLTGGFQGSEARALLASGALGMGAAALHRLRGLPLGSDAPRRDRRPPGRVAGAGMPRRC